MYLAPPLIALVALIYGAESFAHPVSFKGGTGIMPEYSPHRSDLEINYSITATDAIGISTVYAETEDGAATFVIPRFNHRVYRKNEPDSQTNLYLSGGVGGSMRDDASGVAGLLSLQGDFETRRVYTLLNLETLPSSGTFDLSRVRYRAGVAPYLAGFDDLNTWLILQAEYAPEMEDTWSLTPLVRFFYRNYLLEIGASIRGDPFVAGIFHF